MGKKYSLILDEITSDEFILYCKMNEIIDMNKFGVEVFRRGFTSLKYGDKPNVVIPAQRKFQTTQPITEQGTSGNNGKDSSSGFPLPNVQEKKVNNNTSIYDE